MSDGIFFSTSHTDIAAQKTRVRSLLNSVWAEPRCVMIIFSIMTFQLY